LWFSLSGHIPADTESASGLIHCITQQNKPFPENAYGLATWNTTAYGIAMIQLSHNHLSTAAFHGALTF